MIKKLLWVCIGTQGVSRILGSYQPFLYRNMDAKRGSVLIRTPDCAPELAVRRHGRDGCKGSCPGAKLRSRLQGEWHMEGWVSLLCTLHIYTA